MDQGELNFFNNIGIQYCKPIASGGFGSISLVYWAKYQTYFALKKIPISKFKETEVECMKKLDQSNIVGLYDIYKFNNFVYLLMEYCPSDLSSMMKQGELAEPQLCQYCHDILVAIKNCHDNYIAHNDIKPSNFLIDKYGRLKVCDFGISTYHGMTRTSDLFLGTTLFMAPEVLEKKEYDPMKSDVWSIGITFYYMATQNYPYNADDKEILLKQIQNSRLLLYNIDNPKLAKVIKRCLTINPEERATIDELLAMSYFKKIQCSSTFCFDHNNKNFLKGTQSSGALIFKPKATSPLKIRDRNSMMVMKMRATKAMSVDMKK